MESESRVALYQLRPECSARLQRITRKLLSLQTTEHTIAQIIDGLPTRENFFGPRDSISDIQHPDIASRANPTEEAITLASNFCSSFNVEAVSITAATAEAFQQAMDRSPKPDLSRALRFLEASSSLFHDIISNLHRHFHPNDDGDFSQMISFWRLVHRCYTYGAIYKNRYASTAAYWAETLVFGGPVLFQRGENEQQCNAAYIHPPEGDIAQLTDAQILQYMAASNDDEEDDSVDLNLLLPFSIESEAKRLNIDDAIAANVYREPGQLDIQWGDGSKYGIHRRERARESCVRITGPEDAEPGPED